MSGVEWLFINGQVFCLLMLAIPSFAGVLYLLLYRPYKSTPLRRLIAIGLLIVTLVCYRMIGQLVIAGQDINPRCDPISTTQAQCESIGLVSLDEANRLLRNDIVQDSLECVIVPSLIGVVSLVIGLRLWARRGRVSNLEEPIS